MAQRREQPQWLIETQNNSWNPELLISGISILFIFAFADRLNDLAIGIIQDYGVNPLLTLVSVGYVTVAVQALKYAFVLHLVMRGVWVGLVGLNYTFPEGIKTERLPKVSQQPFFLKDLKDPIDIIMRVERICSSIFSIAFMIVGISGWILLFLLPSIVLSALGVPLTWILIALGAVLVLVSVSALLYSLLDKRFDVRLPWLAAIYMTASRSQALLFFRESLLTYQTNLNSKVAAVVFFGFFLLAGFQTGGLIAPVISFIKEATPDRAIIPGVEIPRKERDFERVDPGLYLDNLQDFQRVQKAVIDTEVVDQGLLPVYGVALRSDQWMVEADTSIAIDHLAAIQLNGEFIEAMWRRTSLPTNHQLVWVTYLDIAALPRGENTLTVDRWVWHPYDKKPVYFENWIQIPFWVD